jgi:hypothetical protein
MNKIEDINSILKDFATELLNTMLYLMQQKYTSASGKQFRGLDKNSNLFNSLSVIVTEKDIFVESSTDYFQFFDAGRLPFKRKIPITVILKWLKKRRIYNRNKLGQFKGSLNSLAFAIQRSIFKIGIRPRNVIRNTFKLVDQLYKDKVETGIDNILDNIFVDDFLIKNKAGIFNIKTQKIKVK